MTEKDLPEQPGQPKMSKSWFKDSSVEWDGLQLLQWSDASSQARHTAGENSQYFTWQDQKIGPLWKPEVFPAIFVALFSPSASSPFSHSPLRKPENPSEPENSPIRKAGSPSSWINSHPPLKDALVTILCSEWIRFIMVGSHLYRAMSFHDTKHLA